MFVKNQSRAAPILRRGHVTEELAVAALVVASAYRVHDDGVELLDAAPDPVDSDPPDTSPYVVWEGVSVTAAGRARGPSKAPFVRPVSLRIGEHLRRLAVFGDRVWERQLGGILAGSEALPFEAIDLAFAHAFGGGWDVPPGLLDGTDLPHPGYRRDYPWSPGGVGYYPDAARLDAPLGAVEEEGRRRVNRSASFQAGARPRTRPIPSRSRSSRATSPARSAWTARRANAVIVKATSAQPRCSQCHPCPACSRRHRCHCRCRLPRR
jgi:hypothetical protein